MHSIFMVGNGVLYGGIRRDGIFNSSLNTQYASKKVHARYYIFSLDKKKQNKKNTIRQRIECLSFVILLECKSIETLVTVVSQLNVRILLKQTQLYMN